MTQIVRERKCFRQVLVQSQGARDCPANRGNFDRVSQACAQVIASPVQENLRFVLEPAKSARMNDPRPVALKFRAIPMAWFWAFSTARVTGFFGKRREHGAFARFHFFACFAEGGKARR